MLYYAFLWTDVFHNASRVFVKYPPIVYLSEFSPKHTKTALYGLILHLR